MRKTTLVLLLILIFSFVAPAQVNELGLIRLHVIANSDDEFDQFVKLRVRDAVLAVSKSIEPEEIPGSLDLLEDAAKVVLASYGCDYPVKAMFGKFDFPTKSYGNITLTAGKYTAVRVVIGSGAGQNWWCVMYPPLCFTSETTAHFDEDVITKNGLTQSGRPKFKIKFKLAEIFA